MTQWQNQSLNQIILSFVHSENNQVLKHLLRRSKQEQNGFHWQSRKAESLNMQQLQVYKTVKKKTNQMNAVNTLCQFRIASVTNCYKINGLNNTNFLAYSSVDQKSLMELTQLKVPMSARLHSSWRLQIVIPFLAFLSSRHCLYFLVYISRSFHKLAIVDWILLTITVRASPSFYFYGIVIILGSSEYPRMISLPKCAYLS